MKINRVKTNFNRFRDDELVVLSGRVVAAISENPIFENIVPTIAELQALADSYRENQEVSSRGGSMLERRQKKDSRIALSRALKKWAIYVNDVANGNLIILTSSAMVLAKQPEDPDLPTIILSVRMKDGPVSGQIAVSFEPQKNIKAYEVQVGVLADDLTEIIWGERLQCNSSRKFIIDVLQPGVRYFVRVRARNSAGLGNWSEPVSLIAR